MSAGTIIRIEKLHTFDQVAGAGAHNSRTNPPSHANSSAKIIILRGGGKPATELLTTRLREAHIQIPLKKTGLLRQTKEPRRQRIIALNLLCGVGEEFFRDVDAKAWADRTVAYLDKTFGLKNVISAELHLDERVPHLHAIVAPITPSGRLSAAQIFAQDRASQPEDLHGVRRGNGSVPFFRRLQREYHALCREFDPDLTEPVPGGVLTHRMVSEWREWIARAHQETPTLPPATIEPPSLADKLSPSAYAQRQVEIYRKKVAARVSTLHAKAVLYEEQVASNQHMQRTLQKQDKELSRLNQQLVETQKRFHQLQEQHEDVPLSELCQLLGLPLEETSTGFTVLLPNGTLMSIPFPAKASAYDIPTWQAEPVIEQLARGLKTTSGELVAQMHKLIPQNVLDRLLAYRERHRLASMTNKPKGREHWDAMTIFLNLEAGDFEGMSQMRERLKGHFGITRTVVDLLRKATSMVNTSEGHLAIQRFASANGGIMLVGSCFAADNRLFEQHFGSFREEPLIFDPGGPTGNTVIVSNAIEAMSLLSVEMLANRIRVIVSGEANLEKVARAVLVKQHPVSIIEYAHGRRCGRHRKLRELIKLGGGKTKQLCPSDLRLGTAGFETIAMQVQRTPSLGQQLAKLLGVQTADGGVKQLQKPSVQPVPPTPPQTLDNDSSVAW